jgi:ABC-type lipoprotein export system ATPase subunit
MDLAVRHGELLARTGLSGSVKNTIFNLCGLVETQRTLPRRDAVGLHASARALTTNDP